MKNLLISKEQSKKELQHFTESTENIDDNTFDKNNSNKLINEWIKNAIDESRKSLMQVKNSKNNLKGELDVCLII